MTRNTERSALAVVLGSLGWPLLWGFAACTMFYVLIFRGPLDIELVHRYFATHPVAFAATAMFFVGMAALIIKLIQVVGEYLALHAVEIDMPPTSGQRVEDCDMLLDQLDELPGTAGRSYLANRLRDAFESVARKRSAEGLDEELKYLSDIDAVRQQDSYALVRVITWATPMLGFLGTVIGITQALGDLDPQQLANSIQTAMEGLLSGLYIAFDTTALALTLSIILMFFQFAVDRLETQVLAEVDRRANDEMVGRFETAATADDPHVTTIERMCHQVVQHSESLVHRQAELWQGVVHEAQEHWIRSAEDSGVRIRTALEEALKNTLHNHAEDLGRIHGDQSEQIRQQWEKWQSVLNENARLLESQQVEMNRQSDLMGEALRATGDVISLEQSLNDNLQSLAGSKNFEDTVMSLSAAIHLLNTRLNGSSQPRIDLSKAALESEGSERAA